MKKVGILRGDETLVACVLVAGGILERMRGLLGRPQPSAGHGMYLAPCTGIHTFGMRYDLDVIFLDRSLAVVRVEHGVCPCRCVWAGRGSHGALELASGWMEPGRIRTGDQLRFVPCPG